MQKFYRFHSQISHKDDFQLTLAIIYAFNGEQQEAVS